MVFFETRHQTVSGGQFSWGGNLNSGRLKDDRNFSHGILMLQPPSRGAGYGIYRKVQVKFGYMLGQPLTMLSFSPLRDRSHVVSNTKDFHY